MLPNPGMNFTAFDILTAVEMDNLVENIEALADGTGLNDDSVPASALGAHIATGILTAATLNTTGNKAVTGVGFEPRYVRFDGSYDGSAWYSSWGFMMAASQFANTVGARAIASNNVVGDSFSLSTRCFIMMSVSAGGVVSYSLEMSRVSLDSDGFTINVNATNGATTDVHWTAFR